jgi:hypothetical protein
LALILLFCLFVCLLICLAPAVLQSELTKNCYFSQNINVVHIIYVVYICKMIF